MNQLDNLLLSEHLVWTNEFDWSPVRQLQDRGLSGALVIQVAVKQAGRPIHLTGVLSRAQVKALKALAATPMQHQLTFNDVIFQVRWDYARTELSAVPEVDYANPSDDDYYRVTLRFIEV